MASAGLRCDGCGQAATPEHVARRLQRLEWTTRYRPVHISNLFLGAFSPVEDRDFLYSPNGEFGGDAGQLLSALGMGTEGKAADTVLAEFQRSGFFLTYVLECPLEDDAASEKDRAALLNERLAAVAARVRRSLKPKRVILVTEALEPVAPNIVALNLGCPVVLNDGRPFAFGALGTQAEFPLFLEKLPGTAVG